MNDEQAPNPKHLRAALGDELPSWFDDDYHGKLRGSLEAIDGRCNARLTNKVYEPNTGEEVTVITYCSQYPVERPNPNGRCKWHGGLSPRGPANGNYRNGKYSAYAALPEQYIAAYEQTLHDPDYISLRADIAAVNARIGELVGKLGSGLSSDAFAELDGAIKAVTDAVTDAARRQALERLDNAYKAAKDIETAWAGLLDTMQRKARLVDVERKHQQSIHPNQVMQFLFAVLETVKEEYNRTIEDARKREAAYIALEERLTLLAGESGAVVIEQRKD